MSRANEPAYPCGQGNPALQPGTIWTGLTIREEAILRIAAALSGRERMINLQDVPLGLAGVAVSIADTVLAAMEAKP